MITKNLKNVVTSSLFGYFIILLGTGCTPAPRYFSHSDNNPQLKPQPDLNKTAVIRDTVPIFPDTTLLQAIDSTRLLPAPQQSFTEENIDGTKEKPCEATYYATEFHGRKTASGEQFNMYKLTAAHRTLPFNTMVKVTNVANGKSVIVRINDRGPFSQGRCIDLSWEAAKKIDLVKPGSAPVTIITVQNP